MVATGAPLSEILKALVDGIEAQRPGQLCSILLTDDAEQRLVMGAAPSFPPFFNEAVDGLPIGPAEGACGTAAFTRRRVVVEDIATDPLWAKYAELAARAGLRSCWSQPVLGVGERLLGAFAMYHRKPSLPTPDDIQAIVAAAHLAAIAIERKQAEDALAAKELRIRRVLEERALLSEIAGVGLWSYDPQVDAFEWTGEWLKALVGPGARMETAEEFLALCHPDDRPEVAAAAKAAIRHGAGGSFNHRFETEAGGWVWVRVHLRAEPGPGGLHRILGISQEITGLAEARDAAIQSERRSQQARREAEAQAQRLKVALRAANAAVIEIDYAAQSVWHSPMFVELIGRELTYQEAVRVAWPFIHPQDARLARAAVKRGLKGGEIEPLEIRILQADGAERWIRVCTEIEKEAGGGWRRSISLLGDIDHRKRQELALIAAEKAAQAAAEAKSDFLANISHEIRTPLNGVLAMAELMARREMCGDQRKQLDVIQRSGRDLLYLVDDILDFTKIEAGTLSLKRVAFDVEDTLGELLEEFDPAARNKAIDLRLEVATEAKGARIGDPERFRQIVGHLISNALKFTAQGEVQLRLGGEGPAGADGLVLSVRDTGIGIPPEKLPLLFEKFSQVDPSITRQFGGVGLGLAICRELAVLMGGDVEVESELGVGSCFTATLALPRAHAEAAATAPITVQPPPVVSPRLRILAAEDNATNQLVLRTIIDIFGGDLVVVENGREAVEAWDGSEFDLILMDVQMPVMDGIEATRTIRRIEAERGVVRTPIIALSANVFLPQVDGYIAAGMDGHVAKPIDLAALHTAIETALIGGPTAFGAAAQTSFG